ncbi:PREDICTED: mediator of RNA polymerase II transcription subunit 28 [Mandrillus leucophaeus]|uniref:mediator of RNA polymerase II transcription subunit 28 n=1 Tax=Mandrillus leucophaeus TaxID=9568 RepID=UPI0005F3E0B1|nr:PREDICTED: mediator of RNA polymerase II transcription subunit 28 [Mandrillus leucophaeus]
MAAPLGGMFSGQPPGPPQAPPGLPGQASLLQAAPGAPRPSNSTLVDELESSFEIHSRLLPSQPVVGLIPEHRFLHPCMFIKPFRSSKFHYCVLGVDQCIQKFLDIARQTECFFLQKRLQLSVQKPEQVIKEDVSELRNELQRKDALVQKHLTKLRHWQQVLEEINVQHKKPADIPQGSLAYLEQASANIPAPLKPT